LDVFVSLGIIYNIFTTSDNENGDDFFKPVPWIKIFRPPFDIHK